MTTSTPIMINVKAPSTLPGNYTFEAFINDDKNRPFIAEVVCSRLKCRDFLFSFRLQPIVVRL